MTEIIITIAGIVLIIDGSVHLYRIIYDKFFKYRKHIPKK